MLVVCVCVCVCDVQWMCTRVCCVCLHRVVQCAQVHGVVPTPIKAQKRVCTRNTRRQTSGVPSNSNVRVGLGERPSLAPATPGVLVAALGLGLHKRRRGPRGWASRRRTLGLDGLLLALVAIVALVALLDVRLVRLLLQELPLELVDLALQSLLLRILCAQRRRLSACSASRSASRPASRWWVGWRLWVQRHKVAARTALLALALDRARAVPPVLSVPALVPTLLALAGHALRA